MTEYPGDYSDIPEDGQEAAMPPIEHTQDFDNLNRRDNVDFGPLVTEDDWKRAAIDLQDKKALLGRVLRAEGKDPEDDSDYVFLAGRLSLAKDQVLGYMTQDAVYRFESGEGNEEPTETGPGQ